MNENYGAVQVPLAVLWTNPGEKRPHDQLILSPVPDATAWADTMDTDMRLWLVGKVETQLLYGEPVVILDRQGDWLQVAALEQPTSVHSSGYPGWLPASQVAENSAYLEDRLHSPLVAVTADKATLCHPSAPTTLVSYQTKLPLVKEAGVFTVRLPNGSTGQLATEQAAKIAPSFDPEAMIQEAKKFIGLRYLWGGTSSFGFDCSGFVMRLYGSQGITIPRDANDQANAGEPVNSQNLRSGDLLFFADDNGQGSIHHVGMYMADGIMIHAPNSKSAVREEPFMSGTYGPEFWGARRYLK